MAGAMKQQGVLLIPPGWEARQSQDCRQHYVIGTHFIYLCEKRLNVEQSFLLKQHGSGE